MNTLTRRKGLSSVIATYYVSLFSGLAIAFVTMTGMNSEVTGNARDEQLALSAAESGLSIVRYHVSELSVDKNYTQTQIFAELGTLLADDFNGTLNLNGQHVTATASLIHVPPISIDTARSKATFEVDLVVNGANYQATVTGHFNNISRAVRVNFTEHLGPADNSIMQNGIVSRGSVQFNGSATLRTNAPGGAGIMSLDPTDSPPIHLNGSAQLQSDLFTVQDNVDAGDIFNGSYAWGDPNGVTFPDHNAASHIHTDITPPAWPAVDTSEFANLVNTLPHTTITSSTNTNGVFSCHNVYVQPNANPRFNGTLNITGIMYIAWPNNVNFNGSLNVTGVIVCEPPPYEPSIFATPNCNMTFNGAITSTGVENLPDTSEYAGLRDKTGTFLIAKDYSVLFNGAMGTVNGSLYTSSLRFNGSTTGTVRGSMLADRQVTLRENGSVDITFLVDPNSQSPSGLKFGQDKTLVLQPTSYQEL